MAAQLNCSTN